MLSEVAAHQLTLLSAPAGYGKTLLLADWAMRHPESIAWVSLDDDDNDDRRFWSALLVAFGSCSAVPPGNALHDLVLPAFPSRDSEFLAIVVDSLGTVPGTVRLVLDDVHELTAPDPLRGLASLVRDRPPGLHLVLSGRIDPPLPLARMRLAGQLSEIRAESLRFSLSEAAAMLAAGAVPVRADQLRLLVEETEGWAAGLRLAALSLQEVDDPDRFLSGSIGSAPAVSDYLAGEIMSKFPGEIRELLGAISICDRVSAPLADALWGRSGAGAVLDFLERAASLVISVGDDRGRYRLHSLLRSHLRAELQRQRPDVVRALHSRAADWYASAGRPVDALTHARRSGDPDRVAWLLRRHGTCLIADGEHAAVHEALEWLGDAYLGGQPWLALVAALVATEGGAFAAADGHLARAASRWPPDPPSDMLALRALVRSRRGAVAEDLSDPAGITDDNGSAGLEELGLGPMATLHRGFRLLAEGHKAQAREIAESALDRARRQHHAYITALGLTLLASIAGAEGDYRLMTTLAAAADEELPGRTGRATIGGMWASTMRAYGALLRSEPAECLELAGAEALAGVSAPQLPGQVFVLRETLRGAALFDLGHRGEGLVKLREARAMAVGRRRRAAEVPAAVALIEHRAASQLGRRDVARTILAWAEDNLGPVGEVQLLRARQLAGSGRDRAAGEALGGLLGGRAPVELPWTLVEGRVLACQLALRAGRRPQARRELDQALELSEAMDVLRPLVSGPPEVVDLMTRHLGSFGRQEETTMRVLAARSALGAVPQPVSLTGRERTVLGMLTTQRSIEEIALDLTVSPSTVKTHVRALYGKLGVNSRRDAVAAARQHGVLVAGVS